MPYTVERAHALPANWQDPIFSAIQAAALLSQPGHVLLVTTGGHLLGQATPAMPADVLTLFVAPPQRRQGLATALVGAFLDHAKAQQAAGLTLEVRADNHAAQQLYTTLGLKRCGRRPRYYPDGCDALLFTVSFP